MKIHASGQRQRGEKRNEPNDALNEKETMMIALDEETIRWRNERKKNYPRSAKTNVDDLKKTEQEAAAAKRTAKLKRLRVWAGMMIVPLIALSVALYMTFATEHEVVPPRPEPKPAACLFKLCVKASK